jgi:ABC-2 type transport system permease protein
VQPVGELMNAATQAGKTVSDAAARGDTAAAAKAAATIATSARLAHDQLAASDDVLGRLGGPDDATRRQLIDGLAKLADDAGQVTANTPDLQARAAAINADLQSVAGQVPNVATVPPDVLVQPFEAATKSVVPADIEPIDYFAPSALALLLQHLAVTFAALSLVRDRELGLFELLRVGPLSSWEIISGKTIAYLLVGMVVGVGLLEAAVHLLGVPLIGAVLWVLVVFVLVLLASLALGTLISLISKSETQAVQWAMLTLLAGLFFSGFVLSLDGLTYPVKVISWLLPVTYGIRVLQDVMLRGQDPSTTDLIGLGALILGYGTVAVLVLRRQLRRA